MCSELEKILYPLIDVGIFINDKKTYFLSVIDPTKLNGIFPKPVFMNRILEFTMKEIHLKLDVHPN